MLHIDGINYSPQTETETEEFIVPYYNLKDEVVETATISIVLSTIEAETSGTGIHKNQNADWVFTHSYGIAGMNGNYTTALGLPVFASYKYEGNVTSSIERELTASAKIQFIVYVEDAIYGTTHTYTFTTATRECIGNVTVLP